MKEDQDQNQDLLLYNKYAQWWPLLSAPEEYEEDAIEYHRIIQAYHKQDPLTMLELGSGGGNNAAYLKKNYQVTLCDRAESMLAVSQDLNPECEHICGDMRTIRLQRTFNVVFIHDAICYMTTPEDLKAAMQTAYVHCKPGGVALFVPDYTSETFRPSTYHGGHDGETASMRFLQWDHAPTPGAPQYQIDFAYILRSSQNPIPQIAGETHICGLFSQDNWLTWLREAGFQADSEVIETDELEPGMYRVFIGKK